MMRFRAAGVIGLGYVGLPLSKLLVDHGLRVTGVDLDPAKIRNLQDGISYISDLSDAEVQSLMTGGRFEAASDYGGLTAVEAILICVPTPIREDGTPDLKYVELAGRHLAQLPLAGQLIVLESSTYPGTTEEVLLPILESQGKRLGKDFYLAYSPERINPGDRSFGLSEMPKIVSGATEACLRLAKALYSPVYRKVIPVSSPRAAEMAKVLENSQRFVNISFVNEVAKCCEKMGIDVWEVLEAVNSKPYGNLPFAPGPGVGGHCIPVDPLYLQWKADEIGVDLAFIRAAKAVNDSMPGYIADRVERLLPDARLEGKSLLLIGVAYKKDVNDLRESSPLRVMEILAERGARVTYHDPLVPSVSVGGRRYDSVELTPDALRSADCAVLLMDHSNLPIASIVAHARLVFDTRRATGALGPASHVKYL
ncbi:nucleotide sugar dehydrogenase [Paenibacillus sp.]|uniref:nucleotide sugar dehydrogenase n=1 Tax=Paenibacillus sp. TaxID=58172 RepID=UPI00281247E5|nr:nucleotide sugar dehydrogenase [Paenibacillus sp.]